MRLETAWYIETMAGDRRTRTDGPRDPSNVLLTATGGGDRESAACRRLLGETAVGRRRVLGITYGTAPSRWRSQVADGHGDVVETTVISVGDLTRAAAGERAEQGPPGIPSVRTIADPTDLVGLGLELEEQLDAWRGADAETVVCLDSVSDLLTHVDAESAHRFLTRVTEVVADRGARAHYHFDPASHDDRTAAAVRDAFDAEVDLRADGPGQSES